MLSRIYIQNFALIDQLEKFKKGLQVITAKLAGKSIILGALRLILEKEQIKKAFLTFNEKCS